MARVKHNGSTKEWLYPLDDLSGSVVALVDGSANVQERFLYDLDGNTTFLKADFSPQSTQQSPSQWEFLFGGVYRDPETGLYFDGAGYPLPSRI